LIGLTRPETATSRSLRYYASPPWLAGQELTLARHLDRTPELAIKEL